MTTHAFADRFDWVLTVVGLLAAAAHGTALMHGHPVTRDVRFHEFKERDVIGIDEAQFFDDLSDFYCKTLILMEKL
ncbi:hypothetical protein RHSIM_Rhsim06G0111600 [Rhododendron simsii]|uniref:Thymidine kinase n=1 Tax=Rhododendron simsii TaxID=118357 RepID=A0A834GT27_RHOSS|nr:hypothetical protein RHSIM_Rhsim06G0111600 [Rhododendron simsii]